MTLTVFLHIQNAICNSEVLYPGRKRVHRKLELRLTEYMNGTSQVITKRPQKPGCGLNTKSENTIDPVGHTHSPLLSLRKGSIHVYFSPLDFKKLVQAENNGSLTMDPRLVGSLVASTSVGTGTDVEHTLRALNHLFPFSLTVAQSLSRTFSFEVSALASALFPYITGLIFLAGVIRYAWFQLADVFCYALTASVYIEQGNPLFGEVTNWMAQHEKG